MGTIIFIIVLVLVATGVSFGAYFVLKKKQEANIEKSLGMSLFLIRLPKRVSTQENQPQGGHKELIARAEQMYTAFSAIRYKKGFVHGLLYGKPRIAFEIANIAGQDTISFYVSVPKDIEQQAVQSIHGVYDEAEVQKVEADYTIFNPTSFVAGSHIKLEQNAYLPVATYQQLEKDPLATITSTLSTLKNHEGGAIQIVLEPFKSDWQKKGAEVLKHLRQGKTFHESLKGTTSGGLFAKEVAKVTGADKSSKPNEPLIPEQQHHVVVNDEMIQAISGKIAKPAFRVNVRLVASADTDVQAEALLSQFESAFGQFMSPQFNQYLPARKSGKATKKFIVGYTFRTFNPAASMILNVEELAGLYHLSLSGISTPKVEGLNSRVVAPPEQIAHEGPLQLGNSSFRGETKPVYFSSDKDRARHLYTIGQTGTGKSTFLQEMIRQDILAGRGVAVIDPHGDLIEATLSHIPKERADDIILFEPFDMERPMGLNMLEYDSPEQKDFAVQEMIAIFHKLFPPEIIGPMFEHYMRNAMLAMMSDIDNPGTLVEIPRIFTDDAYMKTKLAKVQDPVVRQFWEQEWAQITGQSKSDMLGYVVSKVGRFIENEMMRNIIGQQKSAFNLGDVMDNGKIFLANLSKGQTGEVNASLLGLILVTKIQMAAMRRANIPEADRKPFYLYIDEFQNFTTDSIATILSEARKYKLNLIMAHQFIAQLDEPIRDSVFGNVGSLMLFRVGADDAQYLENQVKPEFEASDLINMDNYKGILKLMMNGQTTTPFKMDTVAPSPGSPETVGPYKHMAKLKFGRSKREVEREILERANFATAKKVAQESGAKDVQPSASPDAGVQ